MLISIVTSSAQQGLRRGSGGGKEYSCDVSVGREKGWKATRIRRDILYLKVMMAMLVSTIMMAGKVDGWCLAAGGWELQRTGPCTEIDR